MIHVIDVVLHSFSNLFRFHRYSPLEKLYSVILFIAGLSLRDLSESLCLTGASRESVRIWAHRSSSLFKPSKRARRLVAVDETVLRNLIAFGSPLPLDAYTANISLVSTSIAAQR
jgi:hypothetical protein